MKEVTIQELMETAKKINSEGKKWHFHMLTPDCMFNEIKNKQAFMLENTTDDEVYIVYSNDRYMDQGKELVKMLHGDSVTEKSESEPQITNESVKLIVERAKELNKKGVHWHHHMLFPDCILNKHKGKWCIVFEDKEMNKLLEAVFEDEPKDDLRAIEILFYQQK